MPSRSAPSGFYGKRHTATAADLAPSVLSRPQTAHCMLLRRSEPVGALLYGNPRAAAKLVDVSASRAHAQTRAVYRYVTEVRFERTLRESCKALRQGFGRCPCNLRDPPGLIAGGSMWHSQCQRKLTPGASRMRHDSSRARQGAVRREPVALLTPAMTILTWPSTADAPGARRRFESASTRKVSQRQS